MKTIIVIIIILIPIMLFALGQIGPPGIVGTFLATDVITEKVYVTTENETIYKIDTETNTWLQLQPFLAYDDVIYGIDAHNDVIFVSASNHLYRSLDGGNTWEYAENGLTLFDDCGRIMIYKPDPNIVIFNSSGNFWFRSINNGETWSQLPYIGANFYVYNADSDFIAILSRWTTWKSFDKGETWEEFSCDLPDDFTMFTALALNDSTYIVGGTSYESEERVFITNDGGVTWDNITYGYDFNYVTDLAKIGEDIYLSAVRGESESPHAGVFRLDMNNQEWHQLGDSFSKECTGLEIDTLENKINLLSHSSGLFIFDTLSNTTQNLIPDNIFETNPRFCKGNSVTDDHIFSRATNLFSSNDNFSEWTRVDSVYNIFEMTQSPFDEDVCLALSIRKGVYLSGDGGVNWTMSNNGIAEEDKKLINNVYFLSDDIILISGYETMLYSANTKTFIYRSEDQGNSWTKTHTADSNLGELSISIEELIKIDDTYYALMHKAGLQKTEDLGLNWDSVFYLDNRTYSHMNYEEQTGTLYIEMHNSNFSPSNSELYKSSNLIEWVNCIDTFSDDYQIINFAINPNQAGFIYCSVGSKENIYDEAPHLMVSENSGENWFEYYFEDINPFRRVTDFGFLPNTNEMLICVTNRSAFRLDCGMLTKAETALPEIQPFLNNYPNPFNPTTTFSFSPNSKEMNNTKIEIFNIKGQRIRELTIIDKNDSVKWNGKDNQNKAVSSGIYLYKLNVNGKTKATNKCLLLK